MQCHRLPAGSQHARAPRHRASRGISSTWRARSATGLGGAAGTLRIPSNPELQVKQAVAAIEEAWKAGIRRQRIELLLPLIGATDLDDWPGGIRQQFKAAAPLVEGILKQLKQKEGLQGPLGVDIWDQVGQRALLCLHDSTAAATQQTQEN
eukprot:GHRQ01013908.1.p1 GENE.GHRQ01013908.1~~GHRQ01013908.1.p1  ORF type:complete len:151 (+),score=39.96 GHRQ01013908.1:276-728(+)